MSRRDIDTGESLDLLLDTLCNTFAALIFIAILLVVVNSDQVTEGTQQKQALDEAKVELLQRQIANLDADIARLTKMPGATAKAVSKPSADTVGLQAQVGDLERRKREAEAILAIKATDISSISMLDIEETKRLADQKAKQLQADISALSAAKAEAARLQLQLKELGAAVDATKIPKKEEFRLPKERGDGGKQGIFTFVSGGRIYPIYFFRGGGLSENTDTISWASKGSGQQPTLLAARGWSANGANAADWTRFIRDLPKDRYYLSFLVWPDSFNEFKKAKQMASEAGLDVGFELMTGGLPSFGSGGSGPAPRL